MRLKTSGRTAEWRKVSYILNKETDRHPETDVLPDSMMNLFVGSMEVRDPLRWIYWCPHMIRCVMLDFPKNITL